MTTRLRDLIAQYPKLEGISDVDLMIKALSKEMYKSLAQIVAMLPKDEQELILEGTDEDKLINDWNFWGRPGQIPPEDDDWSVFAMVAGRGAGKTRSGAEWVQRTAIENPGCRIALVARTAADVRDVMVNGESGIMNVGQPEERPVYQPTNRILKWSNKSIAMTYSAEEPDQLRGPQFGFAWADEAAAWKHNIDDSGLSTWDNLEIATRLGDNPRKFVTTTPKRTKFMFDLLDREKQEDSGVVITRGSTMENAGNLGKVYLERIQSLYAGTRLAEQELYGLMLEEVEGALWTDDLIHNARIMVPPGGTPPNPPLKVIAVDPSVAENPTDECGIIVAGATNQRRLTDRHCYIIEDASIMGSPAEWAKQVARTWLIHKCPVVVEVNQGGALVKDAIHAINADIPILEVRAHQGKALRAEPVTLKYDQGKVHHIDYFPELESQMVSWVPGETKKSPDRVDALVYAVTALIVKPPGKLGQRKMRAKSLADRRLPESKIGR